MAGDPVVVAVGADGCESGLQAKGVGLKEDSAHQQRRVLLAPGLDDQAKRQLIVNHGLADIQNIDLMRRQRLRQYGTDAGAVRTCNRNE